MKKPRGFALMSKEKQVEMARQGGIAAHKAGKAHEFNSESAREAGLKGARVRLAKLAEKRKAEEEEGES